MRTLLRLCGAGVAALSLSCGGADDAPDARLDAAGDVTYSRDVAPLLWAHCAPCHRPGESGPFALLTYTDARKRARQIADVTADGYMPPWPPAPGYGEFVGARGLTPEQVDLLGRWAAAGAPEGDAAELPPAPVWEAGWQAGTPDLVVEMAQPYMLTAEAGDVFRNFVIPLPLDSTRSVRTVELRPGNPRVVHHAVMMVDAGGVARAEDARDEEIGFGGMELGQVQRPGGHFLGWAPGTMPYTVPDSLGWTLHPGSDLVVQVHMLPSGKPEPVQLRVGFWFSPTAPTRSPVLLRLGRKDLDIAAGEADYVVEDTYYLPVDVELLSIYPHAHYLGHRMEAWADLPDGTTEPLIRIDDWDFNWQNYYRYVRPVALPRGTAVHMRFAYDNSSRNERNPHVPPRRVRYGTQSEDEMGDLILQLLPRTDADGEALRRDYSRKWLRQEIDGYESLLREDPDNADHHQLLGVFYLSTGDAARAEQHLRAALRVRPDFPEAHLNLATVLVRSRRVPEAEQHLRQALDLHPDYGDAHLNLGMLLGRTGRGAEALPHLEAAARLRPDLADDIGQLTSALRRGGDPARR